MNLYADICQAKVKGSKLLAILLDPDKIDWSGFAQLARQINASPATHILVGGSTVDEGATDKLVLALKAGCQLPVILFPGHPSQISEAADGILFLSLLSGRNPDFLIGHQVASALRLKALALEVIPTGYILVESGSQTAVARVSQTQPLDRNDMQTATATAAAAELLGMKLVYLEAGSGAQQMVPSAMIAAVARTINIPLIVGGGIRSADGIAQAYASGADMVVIGTAFERDPHFFEQLTLNLKSI